MNHYTPIYDLSFLTSILLNNSIIIFGAGGIGLNMIQASKLTKAKSIIAVV